MFAACGPISGDSMISDESTLPMALAARTR
jgi:hypothetical protein